MSSTFRLSFLVLAAITQLCFVTDAQLPLVATNLGVGTLLLRPAQMVLDDSDPTFQTIFVADRDAHQVKLFNVATNDTSVIAGSPSHACPSSPQDGVGMTARFCLPAGLAALYTRIGPSSFAQRGLFVSEYSTGNRIRYITLTSVGGDPPQYTVTTLTQFGVVQQGLYFLHLWHNVDQDPQKPQHVLTVPFHITDLIYYANISLVFNGSNIVESPSFVLVAGVANANGMADGPATTATFHEPVSAVLTRDGMTMFVSNKGNSFGGNAGIRKIYPMLPVMSAAAAGASRIVTTLTYPGIRAPHELRFFPGADDLSDFRLFVADFGTSVTSGVSELRNVSGVFESTFIIRVNDGWATMSLPSGRTLITLSKTTTSDTLFVADPPDATNWTYCPLDTPQPRLQLNCSAGTQTFRLTHNFELRDCHETTLVLNITSSDCYSLRVKNCSISEIVMSGQYSGTRLTINNSTLRLLGNRGSATSSFSDTTFEILNSSTVSNASSGHCAAIQLSSATLRNFSLVVDSSQVIASSTGTAGVAVALDLDGVNGTNVHVELSNSSLIARGERVLSALRLTNLVALHSFTFSALRSTIAVLSSASTHHITTIHVHSSSSTTIDLVTFVVADNSKVLAIQDTSSSTLPVTNVLIELIAPAARLWLKSSRSTFNASTMRHRANNVNCTGVAPIPFIEVSNGSVWDASVRPSTSNQRGTANMIFFSPMDSRNVSISDSTMVAECITARTSNIEFDNVALKLSTISVRNANLTATSATAVAANVIISGSSATLTSVDIALDSSHFLAHSGGSFSSAANVRVVDVVTFELVSMSLTQTWMTCRGSPAENVLVMTTTSTVSAGMSFRMSRSSLVADSPNSDAKNVALSISLDSANVLISTSSLHATAMSAMPENIHLIADTHPWFNVSVLVADSDMQCRGAGCMNARISQISNLTATSFTFRDVIANATGSDHTTNYILESLESSSAQLALINSTSVASSTSASAVNFDFNMAAAALIVQGGSSRAFSAASDSSLNFRWSDGAVERVAAQFQNHTFSAVALGSYTACNINVNQGTSSIRNFSIAIDSCSMLAESAVNDAANFYAIPVNMANFSISIVRSSLEARSTSASSRSAAAIAVASQFNGNISISVINSSLRAITLQANSAGIGLYLQDTTATPLSTTLTSLLVKNSTVVTDGTLSVGLNTSRVDRLSIADGSSFVTLIRQGAKPTARFWLDSGRSPAPLNFTIADSTISVGSGDGMELVDASKLALFTMSSERQTFVLSNGASFRHWTAIFSAIDDAALASQSFVVIDVHCSRWNNSWWRFDSLPHLTHVTAMRLVVQPHHHGDPHRSCWTATHSASSPRSHTLSHTTIPSATSSLSTSPATNSPSPPSSLSDSRHTTPDHSDTSTVDLNDMSATASVAYFNAAPTRSATVMQLAPPPELTETATSTRPLPTTAPTSTTAMTTAAAATASSATATTVPTSSQNVTAAPLVNVTTTSPPPPSGGDSAPVAISAAQLEVVMSQSASEAVAATATTSAVVGGAVNPAAATQISRITSAVRSLQCSIVPTGERPSYMEMPIQAAVGAGGLQYYAGSLLLTTNLFVALPFHAHNLLWKFAPTSPALPFSCMIHAVTLQYFLPNCAAAIALLLANGDNAAEYAVAIICGIVNFVVLGLVTRRLASDSHFDVVTKLNAETGKTDFADRTEGSHYVAAMSRFFRRSDDVTDKRKRLYALEGVAVSVLCAITTGVRRGNCAAVAIIVAIFMTVDIVYIVAARPYRTRITTALGLIGASLQLALCCAIAYHIAAEEFDSSPQAIAYLLLMNLALSAIQPVITVSWNLYLRFKRGSGHESKRDTPSVSLSSRGKDADATDSFDLDRRRQLSVPMLPPDSGLAGVAPLPPSGSSDDSEMALVVREAASSSRPQMVQEDNDDFL